MVGTRRFRWCAGWVSSRVPMPSRRMMRRLSIVMVGPIGFASQVAFVLHQGDGPGFSRCRRRGREVHGHPPGAGSDLPQRSVIVGVGPPLHRPTSEPAASLSSSRSHCNGASSRKCRPNGSRATRQHFGLAHNPARPMPVGVSFARPQKTWKCCVRPGWVDSTSLHPQIFRQLLAPVRDDVERDLGALA